MLKMFAFAFALGIILNLNYPFSVYAQGPEPVPTPTLTFENPYTFNPLDLEGGEDNPTIIDLGEKIRNVGFINQLGSIAVTVWVILDNFAGEGVLGYYVVFLLGVGCILWAASFILSRPKTEKFNLSAAFDAIGELDQEAGKAGKRLVRLMKNKPRF